MTPDIARSEHRAYLLGVLDEARADALEARYVADPALVDEIRDEEEALVDDYLTDRLTAVDRVRFDAHYLSSPVHRDRLAVAGALADRQVAEAPRAAASPAFYGWMAMAAAVVLMSLWIAGRPGPAPRQAQTPAPPLVAAPTGPPAPTPTPVPSPGPAPTQTPTPTPIPGSSPAPSPTPSPPSPTQGPLPLRAVFAITLSPMVSRGGAAPRVHRPPSGPIDLEIRLEGTPDPGDTAYDVELQTVEGHVAWRGRAPAASAGSGFLLTLRAPIETLPPNDYVAVVRAGAATRGEYMLRLRGPRR